MRKSIAGAIVVLLVSGCAGLSSVGDPGPSSPLDAYLLPTSEFGGGLSFHVNRSAYVAVFQIYPGRGASLIYPTAGFASLGGRVFGGLHRTDFNSRHNRAQFAQFGFTGYGPEFYLLIASEEPLDTDQFGPFGDGLASALGARFTSMNAYSTMEQLVSLTVPNVASDNWVADYFVQWPDALLGPQQPGVVEVMCNGNVYYVRADRAQLVYDQLCRPRDESPDDDVEEQPTDSIGDDIVDPARRDPVPPVSDRIASTQLRDRAGWEAMRRAVIEDRWDEFSSRTFAEDGDRYGARNGLQDTRPFSGQARETTPRSGVGGTPSRTSPSGSRARPATRNTGTSTSGTDARPTRANPAPSGDSSGGRPSTDSSGRQRN